MLVDYLVYIVPIYIGVPNALRIDDQDRSFTASIQTTSLIDANLAFSALPQFLDALFGVIPRLTGLAVFTTLPAVFSLIDTNKDMSLVVLAHVRPSSYDPE